MKKVLLVAIVGASLLYGNQMEHTTESLKTQQTELEQIKKEIEQLKLEEADLKVLKQNTEKKYAIDEDVDDCLNEYYNTLGGKRSYSLKKSRIVSDASRARIQYINVEAEVKWELLSNDEKLNGTSIVLLQLMNLDGKFSVVTTKENNEV